MAADLIVTPFAVNGDKLIPAQTDPNGFVNFDQGYTPFYEINLASGNPQAKAVERGVQNYLFNLLTANTSVWQRQGFSEWFSLTPNGYAVNAFVMRSGKPYRSRVANNVDDPATTPASWEYVPNAVESLANVPMPSGGSSGPSGMLIIAATDFNSLTTGTYEYSTDAIATASANTPSTLAGLLETITWVSGPSSVTVQRYTDRSGTSYGRGAAGAAWANWTQNAAVLSPAFAGTPTTPTPPQFDTSLKIANMAALQRALGNFRGIVNLNATVTITSAQVGNVFKITGGTGIVATLPTAVGAAGNAISFISLTVNPVTLTAAVGESINFGNANPVNAASQVLPGFGTVTLVSDGAVWTALAQGGAFLNQAGYKPGTLIMWPSSVAPSWGLVRDGSAVSRAVYSALFAILCPIVSATFTSASNVVTVASTKGLYAGMRVEGPLIPAGTTITGVASTTTFGMSVNASGPGTSTVTLFPFGYGSGGSATTFGLPDDRGIFERGYDDGVRGIETSSFIVSSTAGSPTLTLTSGNTNGTFVGQRVTGGTVAGGSTVVSFTATTVTLSANAGGTSSSFQAQFAGGAIGIERQDTLQGHFHFTTVNSNKPYASGSVINDYANSVNAVGTGSAQAATDPIADASGNGAPRTGGETRPRFRAYLPLIAY